MDKEERMRRTNKVVKKRAKIVMYNWNCPTHKYLKELNRLKKNNLSCPCKGCRAGNPELVKYKLAKATNK